MSFPINLNRTLRKLDAKSIRSSHGAAPITAIVIHAYYPEELALILNRLKTIPCEFDLILTGSTENLFANLDQRIPEKARSVNLFIYQNRGRDVGPFVDLIRRGVFDKYQSVLKLHTKRSSYSDKGTLWLETLIDGLIPSPSQVTKIVEAFTELKVGVCGLESQFLVNGHKFWGDNKRTVVKIRANLGLRNLPYDLGFFAGTMFWFSPQSLQALKKLDSSRCLFRYPKERGQRDGTLAHALERIFCDVSISSGHSISSTEEPTLDLQFNKCFENSIPVQKL